MCRSRANTSRRLSRTRGCGRFTWYWSRITDGAGIAIVSSYSVDPDDRGLRAFPLVSPPQRNFFLVSRDRHWMLEGTGLRYGDVLGEKMGLGRSWAGLVLLAATTSLPQRS